MSNRLMVICDVDGTILDLMSEWLRLLSPTLRIEDVTEYAVLKNPALVRYAHNVWAKLVNVNYADVGSTASASCLKDYITYTPFRAANVKHDFTFVTHIPDCYSEIAGIYATVHDLMQAKCQAVAAELGYTPYITQATSEERINMYGDVLIDDQQATVEAWATKYPGCTGIIVAQPWNQPSLLPNVIRLATWKEIYVQLNALASEGESA